MKQALVAAIAMLAPAAGACAMDNGTVVESIRSAGAGQYVLPILLVVLSAVLVAAGMIQRRRGGAS